MAATVTPTGLTVISDAESVTGWTNDTFSLEPDIKVEGANSVSCAQTQNGINDAWYAGGPWNLSNQMVRMFWNCAYIGYFASTNPVQILLGDGSNTDFFTYFPATGEYTGGWVDLTFLADSSRFPTVNLSAITQVGVRVNTGAKPRNVPANVWYDHFRANNGVSITPSGAATTNYTEAAAADAVYTTASGVGPLGSLVEFGGVIFCSGSITVAGDFNSQNETLVYPDTYAGNNVNVWSISTAATDAVINGLVVKSESLSLGNGADVDLSAQANSITVTNSSFINMGYGGATAGGGKGLTFTPQIQGASPVSFVGNSFANCSTSIFDFNFSSCTFSACDTITLDTNNPTMTQCQVLDHTNTGVICASLDQLDDCTFRSPGTGHAIDLGTISASQSMTWNSQASDYAATDGSTGNETVLVNVASGQTLTINNNGGGLTIMNTGPGSVNVISGAVTVRVTAIANDTGGPLQGARVYLKRVSNGTEVLTGVTNVSGEVEDTAYTYVGDEAVTGWIRKSTSSPLYKEAKVAGTISSTGFSGVGILIRDD